MDLPQQQQLLPPPTEIINTHKAYAVATWCIVLGIIASLCVLWRLSLRVYSKNVGGDDYAIFVALVSLTFIAF